MPQIVYQQLLTLSLALLLPACSSAVAVTLQAEDSAALPTQTIEVTAQRPADLAAMLNQAETATPTGLSHSSELPPPEVVASTT
jgi:hypothetical protein